MYTSRNEFDGGGGGDWFVFFAPVFAGVIKLRSHHIVTIVWCITLHYVLEQHYIIPKIITSKGEERLAQ